MFPKADIRYFDSVPAFFRLIQLKKSDKKSEFENSYFPSDFSGMKSRIFQKDHFSSDCPDQFRAFCNKIATQFSFRS